MLEYLKSQNAELKEQLNQERAHNRNMQPEQLELQKGPAVTQGQTNQLLQHPTENLKLPEGNNTQRDRGVPDADAGKSKVYGNERLSRLRGLLKKELHIPFVSRL